MKLTRRTIGRGDQQVARRILFADDDPSIATLIQVSLSGSRYEVVVVKNGLEALKAFSDSAFDIVLLDVMMPYVDGFEACKRIREQSDVPIIMLTARDGSDDFGEVGQVYVPVEPPNLLQLCSHICLSLLSVLSMCVSHRAFT